MNGKVKSDNILILIHEKSHVTYISEYYPDSVTPPVNILFIKHYKHINKCFWAMRKC